MSGHEIEKVRTELKVWESKRKQEISEREKEQKNAGPPVGIIVGSVVGTVVFLALVAIIWWKRAQLKKLLHL